MSHGPAPNFGGKLVLAIFLAIVAGFIWACIDTGDGFQKLLGLFGAGKAPADTSPRVVKKPTPKPEPPKPKPVPKAIPKPPTPKPPATPAPAPRRTYSAIEMSSLFGTLDNYIKRGQFFDARNKLKNTSRLRIPRESIAQFAEVERRVEEYNSLMRETTKQGFVKMPVLTRIRIKNAGQLIVKVLAQDPIAVFYETITGLRSKIDKSRIESMEELPPPYARVEVRRQLQKQAGYKGLDASGPLSRPLTYRIKGGRIPTGLQYFDLADFCARNGLNDELVTLFGEALKRDPNLVTTVHEVKADRMVNVLLYFLSINSAADAENALDHLKNHYGDTRAYRDKVATDTDVKTAIEIVLRPPSTELAIAKPAPAPAPSPAPTPVPANPNAPRPVTPAPLPRPVAVPDASPPAPRPVRREPTEVAVADASSRVRTLIAKGDAYFKKAMRHLLNSDPNVNPDGWAAENKKALEYFFKANNEGYVPAQDLYANSAAIPKALLDRVRETTMRSSLCRKRYVSSR